MCVRGFVLVWTCVLMAMCPCTHMCSWPCVLACMCVPSCVSSTLAFVHVCVHGHACSYICVSLPMLSMPAFRTPGQRGFPRQPMAYKAKIQFNNDSKIITCSLLINWYNNVRNNSRMCGSRCFQACLPTTSTSSVGVEWKELKGKFTLGQQLAPLVYVPRVF